MQTPQSSFRLLVFCFSVWEGSTAQCSIAHKLRVPRRCPCALCQAGGAEPRAPVLPWDPAGTPGCQFQGLGHRDWEGGSAKGFVLPPDPAEPAGLAPQGPTEPQLLLGPFPGGNGLPEPAAAAVGSDTPGCPSGHLLPGESSPEPAQAAGAGQGAAPGPQGWWGGLGGNHSCSSVSSGRWIYN